MIGQASVTEKQKQEEEAIEEIVSGLSFGDWIQHTWESYENQESVEAKFVKALDKIEALLHIAEVGIKDYVPPEFHGDYADKAVQAFDEATHYFPELKDLFDVVKAELKKQFADVGVEWVEG